MQSYNPGMRSYQVDFDSEKDFKEASTLYFNNLDPEIDKMTLKNIFCRYGTVVNITVVNDPTSVRRSYGYIVYADAEQAKKSKEKFQYYKLGRYEILLMFSADKSKLRPEGKIFIKRVPPNVQHIELHKVFAQISPDVIVHIATDEKDTSLNYGYAHYFNPDYADEALKVLQGSDLEGQRLELAPWRSKNERDTKERRNLYVGNLPLIDKEGLENVIKSIFSTYGEIESLVVQKSEQAMYCSALIAYKYAGDAEKAYNNLLNYPVTIGNLKEPLYVSWHKTKNERKQELKNKKDNLYLRNLKMSVTGADLISLFKQYGDIKDIEIKTWTSPDGRTEAQYAFVSYKNEQDAAVALDFAPESPEIQNLFTSKTSVYIRFFLPKEERKKELKIVKKPQYSNNFTPGPKPQINAYRGHNLAKNAHVPRMNAAFGNFDAPEKKEAPAMRMKMPAKTESLSSLNKKLSLDKNSSSNTLIKRKAVPDPKESKLKESVIDYSGDGGFVADNYNAIGDHDAKMQALQSNMKKFSNYAKLH